MSFWYSFYTSNFNVLNYFEFKVSIYKFIMKLEGIVIKSTQSNIIKKQINVKFLTKFEIILFYFIFEIGTAEYYKYPYSAGNSCTGKNPTLHLRRAPAPDRTCCTL